MWLCIKNDFNNEIGIDCREYVLLMSIHRRRYFVSLIWHARLYHANQHNGITFLLSFLALRHYISCRIQNSGSMSELLLRMYTVTSTIINWTKSWTRVNLYLNRIKWYYTPTNTSILLFVWRKLRDKCSTDTLYLISIQQISIVYWYTDLFIIISYYFKL